MRVKIEVDLRGRVRRLQSSDKANRATVRRMDREERRLRQIALAQHIDHLIVTGQVGSLAEIARMCGVSRARVSRLIGLLNPT